MSKLQDIDKPQKEKNSLVYQSRHDTMKLFPLFTGDLSPDLKLKPSVYLREMMLSMDQRMEQLNKVTKKLSGFSGSSVFQLMHDQKDFKIIPPVVLFQSFQPGRHYSATLTVCNVSEGSKLLAVRSKPAHGFSVSYLSKVTSKLAPGISLHFLVKFSPLEDQDYSECLVLETNKYTFDVPLAALGSRPLINFPDSVDLKETLVKIPSCKTFYVKNIGQVPAAFNLTCEKPFSVSPERGLLEVGKMVMITIHFETDILGDFFKKMFIRFETGEELFVELTGSSKNGKIWLDTNSIYVDDTYMGLKRQQKVTLYNDTNFLIKFSWHKFETLQDDLNEIERLKEGFDTVKLNETARCTKLEYNDIIAVENHANVYSRIFKDEVQLLSPKDLLFSHNNFDLDPIEGELWSGGRCVMLVTFSPHSVGSVSCTGYLDVSGMAHRLPLKMQGQGLGPVVELNLRSLDIGHIFLGLSQSYEIVAANKGDIPARIEHSPTPLVFGGTLTVQPEAQCLLPYEMKSFIISFCSGRTGTFFEDIFFKIAQSGEELKISLKGSVVNPTISFDSSKLDFGNVAVGFPKKMSVGLVNQSQVPVAFALRVPSDGANEPITYEHFAEITPKPALVMYCNEFTISPSSGVIEANTTLNIEVTLVTNENRKHSCVIIAENKNSKLMESVSLTLMYESRVATLTCNPPELVLRFSFINYEYTLDFDLTNTSNLPAYFYFPPQNYNILTNIRYETDISEALLKPDESIKVTVTLTPVVVGRVKEEFMMLLFGNPDLTPLCLISCSVQGPNVSSNVVSLDFGKMTLMEHKTLSFELSNDSPISAYFTIAIEEKSQTKWTIDPMMGDLQPGESIMVSVTLQVLDPGTISSVLAIQVENSRIISIGLFASASGCGITIEPNIFPEINLGYLFSRRLHQFVLTLTNPGSRHHTIHFIQDRTSMNSLTPPVNLFRFNPNKFDLVGGGKVQVMLEAQSNRELEVIEYYACQAVINKRGVKQNLGSFQISANFIVPMIEISEELLEFEIKIGPKDEQGCTTTRCLTVQSVTNLPVTLVLELNRPFLICKEEEEFTEIVINLEPGQEEEVTIGFNPPIQRSLVSTDYNDKLLISYKEHPQKDKVRLIGKLSFPNLQFSQHILDFECIPLDFQDHKEIFMVNPTPLPVTFSFAWDPKSIVVTFFEQENIEEILGSEWSDEFKQDPCFHKGKHSWENKESLVGPIPLVYIEPVPTGLSPLGLSPLSMEEGASVITEEEAKDIHEILFPVIQPYFSPEHPTPEFDILPDTPAAVPDVSQVFDLTPVFGTIAPYQSQALNVAFRPQPFMGVAATAICTVVGGPTETIRLSGQSARHLFSLSATTINFGFRVFMESCEETIKITNMSQLPFNFKVMTVLNPPLFPETYNIQVGSLTVEPCFGWVGPQSSAVISVKFYPGLAGEFQQEFQIQVGYLEPESVLVTGYGVLPQVYVDTQHISRPKIPISWGYQAVASLTTERFRYLASGHCSAELENVDDLDLIDWVVVQRSEKVPSSEDILLAVERVIAYNYVKENSLYIQNEESNKKIFTQLLMTGYILDFGSVVLGTTTDVTIMVENKGLVRADVKLLLPMPEKKLKQQGFFVSFQNHIGLPVGRSVPMDITIKPSIQKYLNKEESVHFTFYLQVLGGATVPIYVKALFTVPHIVVEKTVIDFGSVQCGQCCKMCLLLKNSGAVKAEWSVSLVAFKRKKTGKELPEEEMRFSVNETTGVFHPKTAGLIEVGFLPKDQRLYETMLKLEVKHNPEAVMVRLVGSGVEPKFTVSPHIVQFGAHVPYSGPVQNMFIITNPCPFSVQLYFPDFDSDIMVEDSILRVLTNFYKSETMQLPLEIYNQTPSPELVAFYKNTVEESSAAIRLAEFSSQMSTTTDVSASFLALPHNKSVKSIFPRYSKASMTLQHMIQSIPDPFASLAPADVEKNVLELISQSDNKLQMPRDPLDLQTRCTPQLKDETKDQEKGILFAFHGAPLTDYKFWANRIGKCLNLRVWTLDELILQEAATSDKASAVQVQEAINDAYTKLALDQESLEMYSVSGAGVSFEELCERVKFLSSPPEQPAPIEDVKKKGGDKNKPQKSAASRPGTGKKPEAKPLVSETFSGIPVQLFVDLLRDRLIEEVERGVVLEALTGFFLKTINSAVNVILRCVGHISCIEFFSLFASLEEHELQKRICKTKKEMQKKAEEEKKILQFDQMTGEELERLLVEDRQLFESTVLEERCQWIASVKTKRIAGRSDKSPTTSPRTTMKSKGGNKKSGKKSATGSGTTKASKKTDKSKSQKDDSNKKQTNIAQKRKSSAKSLLNSTNKKTSQDEAAELKEAFVLYESELEELVTLLSRWNKNLAEFEGLDKPPSLFNVRPQSRPQTRKKKDSLRKTLDKSGPSSGTHVGVDCSIIYSPRKTWKPTDLLEIFRSVPSFVQSRKSEKEWWDIGLPDRLILASVCKPDPRTQNDKLDPFHILDCKRRKEESFLSNFGSGDSRLENIQSLGHELTQGSQGTGESLEKLLTMRSETAKSQIQDDEYVEEITSDTPSGQNGIPSEILFAGETYVPDEEINEKSSKKNEEMLDKWPVDEGEEIFTTRVELGPGEEKCWSAIFEPKELGVFRQPVQFEVAGWRNKYNILLEAVCDIPRIDSHPSSMFEKVHDTLSPSTISQCVFLNDTKLFYFGPVFATAANNQRTNDLSTNFYFTNISAVEAEVEFGFVDTDKSAEDSAFGCKPKELQIAPGETKALEVFASPTAVGKYSETLVYSILNNPEPGFIEMSCIGIKPDFDFEPKEIRFERVLLYRKEFSELTLTNKCYKPLGWRLVDLAQLSKQVSVSQRSGVIPAMQNTSVYINFSAMYVEVASHVIYIEVYDDHFRGSPFISEPIPVTLESVDVLVDIMYPKDSDDSELRFNAVKVGEPEHQTIVMKNKGKYDVTFSIKFNPELKLNFNPQQVFTFTPKSGVLPKLEKSVPVKITCMCSQPVHINKVPVFKVWLVDTGPGAQPVAAIPVTVSISAFSPQYKVIPETELNFSSMLMGTKKVEHIVIENTGKFEFEFRVQNLEQIQLEKLEAAGQQQPTKSSQASKSKSKTTQDSGRGSLKTAKGKQNAKGKEKKKDSTAGMTVGVFTLSHSGGSVLPGESFVINVECSVPAQGIYYEVIVIKIMEYALSKKKGTHIKLKSISYIPSINFDNLNEVFQEACPATTRTMLNDGEPHIIHNREKNILQFSNACMGANNDQSLNLHLYNSGLVPCEATAAIVQAGTPPAFHVTPDRFSIMSLSEMSLTVAFQPTQIGTFTEVLEVKVMLPSPLDPQVFTVTLVGDAHLPQILVTKPPSPPTPSAPHTLMFPPTLVGEICEDTVVFINNGTINCTVIVEILKNNDESILFSPANDRAALIKGNIHQVHLKVGEVYEVVARFCPQIEGKVTSQVKLYVTNNPYEDQTIVVQGVGYMKDVIIDGLPLVKTNNMNLTGRPSELNLMSMKYQLDLGACSVGEVAKRVFLLKNQTENMWYRFQWGEVENITISPSLGHLPPASSKEILITFQSHQPKVVLESEEVVCKLSQIELKEESSSPVGWDDHQKTIKWVSEPTEDPESVGGRRVVCSREEPEYEELPASSSSLSVVLSACADFPQISCPNEDISFHPTIINQMEEQKLLLQNTGIVPAWFSWTIHNQTQKQVEEMVKACYGSVTMSSERPRLQASGVKKKKPVIRPATCPHVRPGLIPSSVALLSRDDSAVDVSASRLELGSFWPISIEPAQGKIPPGEDISCAVKFRPVELASYTCSLSLSLGGAEPVAEKVVVRVEGSSMLPCCHLVVSDFVPTGDSSQLQIGFRSLGIKKAVYKCIKVVNTTYEDYTFYWRELDQEQLSAFGCSKPVSQLCATKHVEVIFSFTPKETGSYKSTWQLGIPERGILQNVLLTGEAFEPIVSFSPTFLKLRPTLIGVKSESRAVLVNHEDCDLKFSVDANSLFCGNWGQIVKVAPMKGVIPAQGLIDLRVSLRPTLAGQGQFVVQVIVQRLEAPLKLDVVAQCFLVQPQLVYQDFNKVLHHMLSDKDNHLDIGVVEVRIPLMLTFNLTNVGKPAFHYNWAWSSEEMLKAHLSISVTNKSGLVGPQSKQQLGLNITPLTRAVFSNVRLELEISKGPTFVIILSGTAAQPLFKFSFDNYNFGACFIQSSDTEHCKTNLVFTNTDEKPLLVECEFEPKEHLKVGLSQTNVEPRSEVKIPITFLPLSCQSYKEALGFLVDGSYRHVVTITGRGIDFNVILVNPVDKLVNLEGVVVGRNKKKSVEVVNRSEVVVNPVFSLEPAVPQICLSPSDPVKLRPDQVTRINITFLPDSVVRGIEQELCLSFQGIRRVLSVVKAGSVGVSVRLDRDYVPFGSTVIGNSATSKLLLSNIGDLAVKFFWELGDQVFTITPQEGYVAPATDVALTIEYSPEQLQPIIHSKGVCTLSNGDQLGVKLSGSCVDLPPPSMTIPLSCPVRQTTTTQIPVFNKFGKEISLTASISGEYFSGDHVTLIPAYGTHMFEIIYSPLFMTTPSQLHKGTAIFYFVDGTCLVYCLEGTATEPEASDRMVWDMYTQTPHTLLIPVHNWLQTSQKFLVEHELLSTTSTSPKYQLSCNEYFMVSGSQTRELVLNVTCHFPGTFTFKVVLRNESSGEYVWYEVVLEVSPCPPLGEIQLQSAVRRADYHDLMFRNPLDVRVVVECNIDVPGLSAVNVPLTVESLQQSAVKLKYLPLWPCEASAATLELTSSDLGVFPYTVSTTALPSSSETPLHFSCDLGMAAHEQITLVNFTKNQAVFHCTSSHEDVTVESEVTVASEDSKSVDVSYQPSSLSNITAEIVATSSETGEFIFPVIGICKSPEPKGPYSFTPGSSTSVSFRNVFMDEQTFVISTDNPAFAVKETNVVLQHNQVVDLQVEMLEIEVKEYPKYPVTGKMSVYPKDESLSHIRWVFYLHGNLQETLNEKCNIINLN